MEVNVDAFSRRLDDLIGRFGDLGAKLGEAASELQVGGAPPADALVEALAAARLDFVELHAEIVLAAETLGVAVPDYVESARSLEPVLAAMATVLETHRCRVAFDDARNRIVAVLDRIDSVRHEEDDDFGPLVTVKIKATDLKQAAMELAEDDPDRLTALAATAQPFADLLTMLERTEGLDDVNFSALEDSVGSALGRQIVVAAARHRLLLPGQRPRPREPRLAEPIAAPVGAETVEPERIRLADALPVPEPVRASSPDPVPLPSLEPTEISAADAAPIAAADTVDVSAAEVDAAEVAQNGEANATEIGAADVTGDAEVSTADAEVSATDAGVSAADVEDTGAPTVEHPAAEPAPPAAAEPARQPIEWLLPTTTGTTVTPAHDDEPVAPIHAFAESAPPADAAPPTETISVSASAEPSARETADAPDAAVETSAAEAPPERVDAWRPAATAVHAESSATRSTAAQDAADETAQWWLAAWARWSGWKNTMRFPEAVREELGKYPYLLSVPVQQSADFEDGLLAYGYSILLDHVEREKPGSIANALNALRTGQTEPVGSQLYTYLVAEGRLTETYPQFVKNVLLAAVPEPGPWVQVRIIHSKDDTRVFVRPSPRVGDTEQTARRHLADMQRFREHKFTGTLGPLTTRFFLIQAELSDAHRVDARVTFDGAPSSSGLVLTVPAAGKTPSKMEVRPFTGDTTSVQALGRDYRAVWFAIFNADPMRRADFELGLTLRKDTRLARK